MDQTLNFLSTNSKFSTNVSSSTVDFAVWALKLLSPVVLVVRQFYAHTAPILKADYDIGRYPASIYCPDKIGDINIQILARS